MPPRPATEFRWSNWNLLLLIPLLVLITPVFNREDPHLFGVPFLYWCQMAFVPVGVICVGIVYLKTKAGPTKPEAHDPGATDPEGAASD